MKKGVGVLFSVIFVFCMVGVVWAASGSIKIGTSMGLTGHYSVVCNELLQGYSMAFREANQAGGVHDKAIKQVVYDDGYNPAKTIENLNKLVYKDKVVLLFSVFGTPPSAVTSFRLKVFGIPLFFPGSGGGFLYSNQPYVFTFQASYDSESTQMVKRAAQDGHKNLAVIYLTNTYGWNCKLAALREAHKMGIKATPIPFKSLDFLPYVVDKVLKTKASALYLAIPNEFLVPLLRDMDSRGYHPAIYAEYYCRLADAMRSLGADRAAHFHQVITGRFLPNLDENYPCIRWYKSALDRFAPDQSPTPAGFHGYLMARTLVAILKRVPSLDPQGIIRGTESIKNLDIGLPEKISYSHTDHVGLTRVFMYRIAKGRLVPIK